MAQQLSHLDWKTRFVERFPGDPEKKNFTRQVPGALYSEVAPTPVRAPRLLAWSSRLAAELGLERPDADSLALLSGNRVLPSMRPYSARYGGHQFGHWAGQLGDGRAITLGEAGRMEFQLKGAGVTPYSRRADGRAVLRSSLREYLCSEAMHFLGVPTTRALSLVATGEDVVRDMFYDGNPQAEPGAIVCRVAPSFVRFGNFQILAAHDETDNLKALTEHVIQEFYPGLDLGQFYDEVCRRTARMISEWMRVGFVHGVMNTDNLSILGLTIDYGPYGWLDDYDPTWTPNTTDAEGRRYRYENQPGIALWNLARLGEALFPLLEAAAPGQGEARIHQGLAVFRETFGFEHEGALARKFGLQAFDLELVKDALERLRLVETDMTIFFRLLGEFRPGDDLVERVRPAFYDESRIPREEWAEWAKRYSEKLRQEGVPVDERRASMNHANPKYVLRNYLAQTAIDAIAERDDTSVLERLYRVLERPYDEQPEAQDLFARRPDWARSKPGCSALSCSS